MTDPQFQSMIKSETCADIVKMMTAFGEDGTVREIKTLVYGCGYSIAGASFFNELAEGKHADEVAAISPESLRELMGDIPDEHHGCVSLALRAFKKIHSQYRGE